MAGLQPSHWRCLQCKHWVRPENRVRVDGFASNHHEGSMFHVVARDNAIVACGPVEPALARQRLLDHLYVEHPDAFDSLVPYVGSADQIHYSNLLTFHVRMHHDSVGPIDHVAGHGHRDEDYAPGAILPETDLPDPEVVLAPSPLSHVGRVLKSVVPKAEDLNGLGYVARERTDVVPGTKEKTSTATVLLVGGDPDHLAKALTALDAAGYAAAGEMRGDKVYLAVWKRETLPLY